MSRLPEVAWLLGATALLLAIYRTLIQPDLQYGLLSCLLPNFPLKIE